MSGKYESTPLPIKQTTNRMRATIDYIKRKFDEYNEMCFDWKLKPLPFKLSNAKSFLGAVCFRREKNANGTWHYYGFVFKISTVMDLPEEEVEDTILHEMIHILDYETNPNHFTGVMRHAYDPHGYWFMNEGDKYTKHGFHV